MVIFSLLIFFSTISFASGQETHMLKPNQQTVIFHPIEGNSRLGDLDWFSWSISDPLLLDTSEGYTAIDFAIGAPLDDDGGHDRGAIWIMSRDSMGVITTKSKISDIAGGFNGILENNDKFGVSVTGIGDLNGDGVEDIAVGALGDDEAATEAGAVWILFMNSNGTVSGFSKISDLFTSTGSTLQEYSGFGRSVTWADNQNNNPYLVVGAPISDGLLAGKIWILNLDNSGIVTSGHYFEESSGFGWSVESISDQNGDSIPDLVVGSPARISTDGDSLGAIWILFMDQDGNVIETREIINPSPVDFGVFQDPPSQSFGTSVLGIGDLNGDEIEEIAVGAVGANAGFVGNQQFSSSVLVLISSGDGTFQTGFRIDEEDSSWLNPVRPQPNDLWRFGISLANFGDLDGDEIEEIAVGLVGAEANLFDPRGKPEYPISQTWIVNWQQQCTIEFDKEEYFPNEIAIVTISCNKSNLDRSEIDSISISVYSDSDIGGLEMRVSETGRDSGIFTEQIQLVSLDESSADRLRVSCDDLIYVESIFSDIALIQCSTPSDNFNIIETPPFVILWMLGIIVIVSGFGLFSIFRKS